MCGPCKCNKCNKIFKTSTIFDNHKCVTDSINGSRSERLKRLLASGGCNKEYYEKEMSILEVSSERKT